MYVCKWIKNQCKCWFYTLSRQGWWISRGRIFCSYCWSGVGWFVRRDHLGEFSGQCGWMGGWVESNGSSSIHPRNCSLMNLPWWCRTRVQSQHESIGWLVLAISTRTNQNAGTASKWLPWGNPIAIATGTPAHSLTFPIAITRVENFILSAVGSNQGGWTVDGGRWGGGGGDTNRETNWQIGKSGLSLETNYDCKAHRSWWKIQMTTTGKSPRPLSHYAPLFFYNFILLTKD